MGFFEIPGLKASTSNYTMTIPSGEGKGTVNSPLVTQGTSQFPTYGPAVVVEEELQFLQGATKNKKELAIPTTCGGIPNSYFF